MGDVDFGRLQEADPWMAPMFFTLFNTLAVFVVLNMLIAIISDSYMITAKEMKDQQGFELVSGMANYVHDLVLSTPVIGIFLKRTEEEIYRRTSMLTHMVEDTAHVATDVAASSVNATARSVRGRIGANTSAVSKRAVSAGKILTIFRKYEDQFVHGGEKEIRERTATRAAIARGASSKLKRGMSSRVAAVHPRSSVDSDQSDESGDDTPHRAVERSQGPACQCAHLVVQLESTMNRKIDSLATELRKSQQQNVKLLELVENLSVHLTAPSMALGPQPPRTARPQLVI
jgi:hypothetical protein